MIGNKKIKYLYIPNKIDDESFVNIDHLCLLIDIIWNKKTITTIRYRIL